MRRHGSKPIRLPAQLSGTIFFHNCVLSYAIQSPNLNRQQPWARGTRRRLAIMNHTILHPIRRTLRTTNPRVLRITLQLRTNRLYFGNFPLPRRSLWPKTISVGVKLLLQLSLLLILFCLLPSLSIDPFSYFLSGLCQCFDCFLALTGGVPDSKGEADNCAEARCGEEGTETFAFG
jgi:hypothetical protein